MIVALIKTLFIIKLTLHWLSEIAIKLAILIPIDVQDTKRECSITVDKLHGR